MIIGKEDDKTVVDLWKNRILEQIKPLIDFNKPKSYDFLFKYLVFAMNKTSDNSRVRYTNIVNML